MKQVGGCAVLYSFWRRAQTAFHRFPELAKKRQVRRYLGTYPCHKGQNLGNPEKSWGPDGGDDHRIL